MKMAAHPGAADDDVTEPEDVAGGLLSNPLRAAAIIGGAVAAGAGAYAGARALARRNGARVGQPVSSVMANAITATDVKPH
jgi:hypothetical protein